jgi:hypothetical protein
MCPEQNRTQWISFFKIASFLKNNILSFDFLNIYKRCPMNIVPLAQIMYCPMQHTGLSGHVSSHGADNCTPVQTKMALGFEGINDKIETLFTFVVCTRPGTV